MITSAELKAQPFGGLLNESVMQQIWDISAIPLPFTDRVGSTGVENSYAEWTKDVLAAPDTDNAVVDGAPTNTIDDTELGTRVGNQCQISVKVVSVSTRSRNSSNIGTSDQLSRQVMRRQQELRRDVEAIDLTGQGSVADDGSTTAGRLGGLDAWLETNTNRGVGGLDGGFSAGVVAASTPGASRALDETTVRDIAESVYNQGGDPQILMSTTGVIRTLSNYMFTPDAKVATLQADVGQSNEAARAKGAVSVFNTDFGVSMEFVANRLQAETATGGVATLFFLDPGYVEQGLLHGYRTEPLAKVGLADQRQMAVDHTLIVMSEEAQGLIADIDPSLPMLEAPVPPV